MKMAFSDGGCPRIIPHGLAKIKSFDRMVAMEFESYSFRLAKEILKQRPAWHELEEVLHSIEAEHVLKAQNDIVSEPAGKYNVRQRKAPAGAQAAINKLFKDRLVLRHWKTEPVLFPADEGLGEWKMDFLKDKIGVEVSFNHAEAIAWTFTRVTLAGESTEVIKGSQIEVAVAIYATQELKKWGKMDSAVGPYERAKLWLTKMRPVKPIPILLVGLKPHSVGGKAWPHTSVFRGTKTRG